MLKHLLPRGSLIRAGLQRLVVAGTCYEYGLQYGPLKEDQNADPANCYSIAKDGLRRVLASRCQQQGVQWCWLRIFYPYGPGQNPKSLVPSLLQAIKAGAHEFPMGSGRQLRDFIPVQAVAQQLLTLVTHLEAAGVYNGGSGVARSVLDFAEELIAVHGSCIALKRGAVRDRSDEPLAFWADMQRFQALQSLSSSQL